MRSIAGPERIKGLVCLGVDRLSRHWAGASIRSHSDGPVLRAGNCHSQASMVEFVVTHECDLGLGQQLEEWVFRPSRGPTTAFWNRCTASDRREVVWGLATQLADLQALTQRAEAHPSTYAYVSARMTVDHPGAWERIGDAFEGHSEAFHRKFYRLVGRAGQVVTTYVTTVGSDKPP